MTKPTRHDVGNYFRGLLNLDNLGRAVRQFWWVETRHKRLQHIVLMQTDTTSHARPDVQLCRTSVPRASASAHTVQTPRPTVDARQTAASYNLEQATLSKSSTVSAVIMPRVTTRMNKA